MYWYSILSIEIKTMFSTDDWLLDKLGSQRLQMFCNLNIHPNIITFMALVLSCAIPFLHMRHLHWVVFSSIIIRQLCDCLDGAVARKCEKTSKLGGYLDTTADTCFVISAIFVFFYIIIGNLRLSILATFVAFSLLVCIHLYKYNFDVLYDHSALKASESDSFYTNCMAIITNNTMVFTGI